MTIKKGILDWIINNTIFKSYKIEENSYEKTYILKSNSGSNEYILSYANDSNTYYFNGNKYYGLKEFKMAFKDII